MLEEIRDYFKGISSIFAGIDTELLVIENIRRSRRFGVPGIKAPYYLALYSEEKDRKMMNAGYLMEQMSLFLLTKGLGSCFFAGAVVPPGLRERNGKQLLLLLAFGKERPGGREKRAKRLGLSQVCAHKEPLKLWVNQLLEAAVRAPSAYNSQPWRFLYRDGRIHVFSRNMDHRMGGKLKECSFGAMFCHMMVAAEEFWLDVDLIRLEDISQKNFSNAEYMLSIILNT